MLIECGMHSATTSAVLYPSPMLALTSPPPPQHKAFEVCQLVGSCKTGVVMCQSPDVGGPDEMARIRDGRDKPPAAYTGGGVDLTSL